jgi:TolB-like protein
MNDNGQRRFRSEAARKRPVGDSVTVEQATAIERAAADWLVRLDASPVDAEVEARFRTWLDASPEHETALARAEAAIFLTERLRGDPELGWAFDDAAEIASGKSRVRPRLPAFLGVLARPALAWSIAAAAVAVATMALVYRPQAVAPPSAAAGAGSPAVAEVSPGVEAPDAGSLGAGSPDVGSLAAGSPRVASLGGPSAGGAPARGFVIPTVGAGAAGVTLDNAASPSVVELPGRVVVDAHSVAVLPFVTEGGAASVSVDAQQFADALHGQITSQLASVPGFYVIEPRAVLPYSNLGLLPREIAAQLGVRGIVQGRVRLDDDNVRVALQLTDAASDVLLLEDAYDREVADLASMEYDIAIDIATALAAASPAVTSPAAAFEP